MKYTPRLPSRNYNISEESPILLLFKLVGGISAVILVAYVALGWAVGVVASGMSAAAEQKIAGLLRVELKDNSKFADQRCYIQGLVDRLQASCAHLDYNLEVHIEDSDVCNAVAMPGGIMVFNSGLLEKLSNENELSFVLGHEMGHYRHRDHLKAMGRSVVLVALSALFIGNDGILNGLIGKTLLITELSFSRRQETLADEFAVDVLNCAYGHSGGAISFLKKIPQEQDPGKWGNYFSSHPENIRRIRHLKEYVAQHHYHPDGPLKRLSVPVNNRNPLTSATGKGGDIATVPACSPT